MNLQRRKKSRPYGQPTTPFDPRTGTFAHLGDGAFRELTVLKVGHDALLCEDQYGRDQLVLKPWALRKSSFNGQTFVVDGVSVAYASTSLDVRNATPSGGDAVEETVGPHYFVGDKIVAYKRVDDGAGLAVVGAGELTNVTAASYLLEWEDLNTAGRAWQEPASAGVFSGAMVYRTTELTLSGTTAANNKISWEAAQYNPDDAWALATNPSRLTCKTAGLHSVQVLLPRLRVNTDANPSNQPGSVVTFWLFKNGVNLGEIGYAQRTRNDETSFAANFDMDLAVDDYLELSMTVQYAASYTIRGIPGVQHMFGMTFRVGTA